MKSNPIGVAVAAVIGLVLLFAAGGAVQSSTVAACTPNFQVIGGEVVELQQTGDDPFSEWLALYSEADSAEQQKNAALIVSIGEERPEKFSDRDIAIAIGTAIQESGMLNLDYGDRDSLGIYQQRPSVGSWGTAEEIRNPTHAINQFYDSLADVANRDSKSMMDVAIEVQIPSRAAYERTWKWDGIASYVVSKYKGSGGTCVGVGANAEGWRVPLEPGVYNISSPFDPWRCNENTGVCRPHDGTDLAAAEGTPIYAAHAGAVTYADWNGGYGNFVRVDHGGGIVTEYGHMIRIDPSIFDGMQVVAGQVLGYVGNTGASFGNHLHFNLSENGKYVDAEPFLLKLGVNLRNPTG